MAVPVGPQFAAQRAAAQASKSHQPHHTSALAGLVAGLRAVSRGQKPFDPKAVQDAFSSIVSNLPADHPSAVKFITTTLAPFLEEMKESIGDNPDLHHVVKQAIDSGIHEADSKNPGVRQALHEALKTASDGNDPLKKLFAALFSMFKPNPTAAHKTIKEERGVEASNSLPAGSGAQHLIQLELLEARRRLEAEELNKNREQDAKEARESIASRKGPNGNTGIGIQPGSLTQGTI